MAEIQELKATARDGAGKAAARSLRRGGQIPAIVYGDQKPPEKVTLEYKTVNQLYQTGRFLTTVYMMNVGGRKTRVIPRDVQLDPVRDFPLHVDFLRLSKAARIDVAVQVHFINEQASPGMKRGGALNIAAHEIELSCPADAIPESIQIDLTGMEIGDAVHISNISLPPGVTFVMAGHDFTIASIAGAQAEEVEAAAGAPEEAESEEKA